MRAGNPILSVGLSVLVGLVLVGCKGASEPAPGPGSGPGAAADAPSPKGAEPPAKPSLVPVTSKDPEAIALFEAGRIKADRLRRAEAAGDFRAAVERDPDFALAWLHLASLAGTARDYDAAISRAISAKEKVTEDERLLIDAAVAEHEGRISEAQELRQEICRRHPEDARARYQLGLSYWMSEDAKAVGHMERAVELYPGLDAAWNMLGYVYSSLGRKDDAVRTHRQYVELLPDEPNAHDSLAETLMKAGKFEESIQQYEKALELDPGFHWSRLGIGHNQVFLGRHREAAQSYRQALAGSTALYPKYQAAEWLVVLGVYAGNPGAALEATDQAVEIAAKRGEVERCWAERLKARIQLWGGKIEDAEKSAGAALSMLPDNVSEAARQDFEQSIGRLRVEILVAKKDLAGARAVLEELRAAVDASESAWHRQMFAFVEGYLLLAEGNHDAARIALEQGTPTDPRVLYYLAEALTALGKTEEAKRIYRRIVEWNAPSLGHALVFDNAKARLAG